MYSIDNFNRIQKELEELGKENFALKEQISELASKLREKTIDYEELEEKFNGQKRQLDYLETEDQPAYQNDLLPDTELNKKFKEFVDSSCIVRAGATEKSTTVDGRYRLWNHEKPLKEVFHAFKNYMDIRFKPQKVDGAHSYVGVELKPVIYKKRYENGKSDVETFLFQKCDFSDNGKILNGVLLTEFQKWKLSVDKTTSKDDLKELKDYLKDSPYALKSCVWTPKGVNEGYYGLSIKDTYENLKPKITSSTAKKVEKRDSDNNIVGKWNSIADAALSENMCAAKMSRAIKNKTIYNECHYCVSEK